MFRECRPLYEERERSNCEDQPPWLLERRAERSVAIARGEGGMRSEIVIHMRPFNVFAGLVTGGLATRSGDSVKALTTVTKIRPDDAEAMQALNRSLGYFDKSKVITYQGPLP